jgi:tetratricopeptide (TPR) repeat protein
MRNYLFLMFILLAASSLAASEKEMLAEANKYYMAQEFTKAAGVYEQILASGKESAGIYFNLGNAYYKSGDKVKAILNYERAKLLEPQNEDIEFNLQIANKFVVDNIEQLPQPFFARWWSNLANIGSAGGWARMSVCCFLLFLILLGSYFFSRSVRMRKLSFYSSMLTLFFLLISFSLGYHQFTIMKRHNTALIQCPRVTVKSAPSTTGTDLFLIHEGLKVEITDGLNTWKEIQLSDGNKGWVADSCLVRI